MLPGAFLADDAAFSGVFLRATLDALGERVAVIDAFGDICYANETWNETGDFHSHRMVNWQGVNYLDVCDQAAATGDADSGAAARGVRAVIDGRLTEYTQEYDYHSIEEQCWYRMRVAPCEGLPEPYFVITHQNITNVRLAQEAVN